MARRVAGSSPLRRLSGADAGASGSAVEGRANGGWLMRILAAGAREWGMSRPAVAAILIVPFLVVGVGLLTAILGKEAYARYVGEDRFAETLQVGAFAVAALFSLLAAARMLGTGERRLASAFLLMGAGLLFVAAEEISWGQRIFAWETPEALMAVNRQQEANLHNIFIIEFALRWAQFVVGAWGSILPLLLLRYPSWLGSWRRELDRLVPHVVLVPYFACTLIWRFYRNLAPRPTEHQFLIAEWSEVMELNLALGCMLFLFYQWRKSL